MSKSSHIFKEQEAKDIFMGVKGFNFGSIEAQARAIIDNANRQAEQMIARAKAEVERMRDEIRGQEFESARKDGQAKGYQDGKTQGLKDGKEQAYSQVYVELKKNVGETPKVLQQLIQGIESHRADLTSEAHTDILSLGFAIGERVARLAIEKDPSVVKKILSDAIDLVLNRNTLDVSVNPQDLAAIQEFIPEVKKQFADIQTLRLHTDEKLSRGSVSVKTGRGMVGIHVDELIDAIAQELLGFGAADALDRIMEGLGKELGNVEMKSDLSEDESVLADALADTDVDAEEFTFDKGKTGVFMQDSFLDSYQGDAEEDAPQEARKSPGSFTRVLTAELLSRGTAEDDNDDHVSLATAKVQQAQGGIDDLFGQVKAETGALPDKPADFTTDDLRNIDTKVFVGDASGTPSVDDLFATDDDTGAADGDAGLSLEDLEQSAQAIDSEEFYTEDDQPYAVDDDPDAQAGLDAFGDPFADHGPESLSIMPDIGDPLAPSNFTPITQSSPASPQATELAESFLPQALEAPEAPDFSESPEAFDAAEFGPDSGAQEDARAFGMSDTGSLAAESGEAELDLDSALAELNALAQEANVGMGAPSSGGGLDDALAELDLLSAEAGLGMGESGGLNPWDEDNSDLNTGSIMGDSFLDDLMGGK